MCEGEKKRTESEALFEEYLKNNGYQCEFEPCIPGCRKHPDYLVRWCGQELLFEVKELCQKGPLPTRVTAKPFSMIYKSLREEINEARKKFQEFEKWSCSLVVCNLGDWTARLKPPRVFEAMRGDLRLEFELDETRGTLRPETMHVAFGEGGKMVNPRTGQPQNTTISAIIVLDRFSPSKRAFFVACEREQRRCEAQLGRPLEAGETLQLATRMQGCYPQNGPGVPSVVICENPCARMPLPRGVFQGPYDERWAWQPQCVFCGGRLREQLMAEQCKCDEPEAPR